MMSCPRALAPRSIGSLLAVALAFALCRVSAADECRTTTAALRESLELVVEAVIDGHPAQAPPAAKRTDAWWAARRQAFAAHPEADSMMGVLRTASLNGTASQTACAALRSAVASFEWCGGPSTHEERLFLVDLAAMTAWLRARGTSVEWPTRTQEATDALATELLRRKRPRLAARLRANVASVLAAREAAHGDVRAAKSLLDLVDVVEKVLL